MDTLKSDPDPLLSPRVIEIPSPDGPISVDYNLLVGLLSKAFRRAIWERFDRVWSLFEVEKALVVKNYNVQDAFDYLITKNRQALGYPSISLQAAQAKVRHLTRDVDGSNFSDPSIRHYLLSCGLNVELVAKTVLRKGDVEKIFPPLKFGEISSSDFPSKTFLSNTLVHLWPPFYLPDGYPPGKNCPLRLLVKFLNRKDNSPPLPLPVLVLPQAPLPPTPSQLQLPF